MAAKDAFLTRFGRMTALQQTLATMAACIVVADALTLLFYSIFFYDRLLLDLILTSVIVVAVSFPLGYVLFSQNVKLHRLASQLSHAANIDDLTGLRNRKTFFREARERILAAPESTPAGALLFIDADHFKSVNDTYGHAVGDAVLRELGAAIQSCARDSDVVARLGGEEFAVFLTGADHNEALLTGERIREAARKVGSLAGIADRIITVSIGLSLHRPGQGLEELLLQADKSLYTAKGEGRDRVVRFLEAETAVAA